MQNRNISVGRSQELVKKIPDYRARYQPIELQLQKEGGLKKQIYEPQPRLEEISIKGIAQLRHNVNQSCRETYQFSQTQVMKINHDGLISEIAFCQDSQRREQEIATLGEEHKKEIIEYCEYNQVKVMICITMYSEPLQELQKSLKGILDSLDEFYQDGILPNQILVVVIYDGIENIRNQGDENGNNQEGDIIPYFCQYLDKQNKIEGKQTLEEQYKLYKLNKQLLQKYSLEQRKRFLQRNDFSKDQFIKRDPNLNYIKKNYTKAVQTMESLYNKAKEYIDLRQNNALVYQSVFTTMLPDQEDLQLPIFNVFKFANGTKLSSHLWFFKGFCQEFQPEYCVLMDCGAKPQKGSIYYLIKELIDNKQVGGVCGTMSIELSKSDDQKGEYMDIISKILNVDIFNIERCQKCEYDIGNLLDKQFESALNFIQVLPGAYSAYRYKAFSTKYQHEIQHKCNDSQISINNQILNISNESQSNQNEDILNIYLKSKLDPNYEHETLEEANMFLAEDRVLCLYLFCNGYYLKYVRNALVEVDPPQNIIQLLLQRRRWINGSYFALNYVIRKFGEQLPNSGHSQIDKSLFILCLVFAKISQLLQYHAITLQIVWLFIVVKTLTENLDKMVAAAIKQLVIGSYVFLVFILIYLSLTYNSSSVNMIINKQQKEKERNQINQYYYSKFYGISTVLGLVSLLIAGFSFYFLIIELVINQSPLKFISVPQDLPSYIYFIVLISFIFTVLPFILQLFIDWKLVFKIAINSIHYIYYMPTYTHLFITYSFCRIDDLTWGTKGLISELENKGQNNKESDKKFQKFKFVAEWILRNVFLTLIFYLLFQLEVQNIMVIIILSFGVVLSLLQLVKFIGYFKYWCQFIFIKKSPAQMRSIDQADNNNNDNRVHPNNEQQCPQKYKRKGVKERSKLYKQALRHLYQPFQNENLSQQINEA
ncbi:unnamed protein product [Paramecium primaurelia]|uniref:chitin synthase n=1 Tax=Paramecium primaurelia TaxID=5886 RepID=A0A8S1KM44_PARPR|nr:unnamed protein product [Paramecium primaurelia]